MVWAKKKNFSIINKKEVERMIAYVVVGDVGVEEKGVHVYYFEKEIEEEDLDWEISQLKEFYDGVIVLREGES
jgi:hypothetical protein